MRGELLEELKKNIAHHRKKEHGTSENETILAVYMCTGTASYVIQEEEVLLREGELLVIGKHALKDRKGYGSGSFAISFPISDNFSDVYVDAVSDEDSFVLDFFIECLKTEQQKISYIHFKVADMLPIQNLMENILWMTLNEQESYAGLRKKNIALLMQYLAGVISEAEIGNDCVDRELALKVYTYIEHHYKDGELSYLAQTLGYKLSYLSGEIKKLTGKTYTDLLQRKRLYQAVWLLKYTDLSITDIAVDIGYHNFTYFYKLFVSKFGVSPRNYRVSHNRSVLIS